MCRRLFQGSLTCNSVGSYPICICPSSKRTRCLGLEYRVSDLGTELNFQLSTQKKGLHFCPQETLQAPNPSKLPLRQVKAIPSSKRSLASPCTSTHLRTPSLLIFLNNDCSGLKNGIKAKELVGKGYHFLRRFVLSVRKIGKSCLYFLKPQQEYGPMIMRQKHSRREHSWHQRTSLARLQLHQCCLQRPP